MFGAAEGGSPGQRGHKVTPPPPGIGSPNALLDQAGAKLPPTRSDGLKVQRAGLPVRVGPDVVAETLAHCGATFLSQEMAAFSKGRSLPPASCLISPWPWPEFKRFDRSKILHGLFLIWRASKWRSPLGGVKEGERCDLAPRTVDFDW